MLLPTYTLPQNIPQLGTLVAEFELCTIIKAMHLLIIIIYFVTVVTVLSY